MVTLTIGVKQVSSCSSSNAPALYVYRRKFCQVPLAVFPGLRRTNRTHLPRGRPRSRMNECTSFWTFRVVGMAGRRRKNSRSTSTFEITNFHSSVRFAYLPYLVKSRGLYHALTFFGMILRGHSPMAPTKSIIFCFSSVTCH
jgi:hypothetical protein